MQAEVISIGDELTSGQRLDTNSQWLSQRLGDLGIRVLFHTTVGDDLTANVEVFRNAFQRADLVVSSGGLGPTADDLTRQAIADALGVRLVLDEPSLVHIQNLFARRGREMPPQNVVQAQFPAGSRIVPNPHGSAPGIDADVPRSNRNPSRVFALPGVPAEMREMWQLTVEPQLQTALGNNRRVIRDRRIKCFGVGESDLEGMLPDLIRRGREPRVGITVSQATITLRVTAEGDSEEACRQAMEPTIATIDDCLGDLIFGEADDELQHAVVRLLNERRQTLATVEWGTGGLVARWLSDVDSTGETYRGGLVVRNTDALTKSLGVADDILQRGGAGGSEAAAAMAAACRDRFETDYVLAVGALPTATDSGHVSFALASRSAMEVKSALFAGHPDILFARCGKQALNLLRLALLK